MLFHLPIHYVVQIDYISPAYEIESQKSVFKMLCTPLIYQCIILRVLIV